MEFKTISYQSAEVFYRVTGTGSTVVLIHGFGEDGEIWNEQVEHLKSHHQLIIPDLPGSGRSEMEDGRWELEDGRSEMGVGFEAYAAIIKAILTNEGIGHCILIGHSMGGYITLAFAEKYPEMLSAFGLAHSTAFADSEEKKATRSRSIEFIKNNGAYEFLKTSIPGLFTEQWKTANRQKIDALIEKGRGFSSEALIGYYQAMMARPDRTAVLKNFPGPILFIIGEQDTAVPFRQSLQQSYLPNRAYTHILRNSAHMGMLEETDKVNGILKNFLCSNKQLN